MKKASISETKNRLSALLNEVRHGETILIVDRDRPIARLEAVRPGSGDAADWIGELERRGVVRRGCGGPVRKLLSQRPPRAKGGASALAALREERAEGR